MKTNTSATQVLEFNLEVLDDFLAEAKEVNRYNRWLNYALPMHRCRELGYHDRLFDLLGMPSLSSLCGPE